MRPSTTKTIASLLSIIILANSLYFVLPDRANAAAASADGGAQEVFKKCGITKAAKWLAALVSGKLSSLAPDPAVAALDHRTSWQKFWDNVEECLKALWKMLIKIAFNKFKKHLLDRLTDDVVAWISGTGGNPKFVTNFNSVLRDSADAALGDTLQEIGAGQLCDAKLGIQLQLNLQTPPKLSKAASCTLSKVIGNVRAFADNFENGSWLAYQEVNSLQNNKYGLQLLAIDDLSRRKGAKTDALKTETAGTKGFLSTKMCITWSVIGRSSLGDADNDLGPETVIATFLAGNDNSLIDPSEPPSESVARGKIVPALPLEDIITKIVCKAEGQKITTPGETLGTILGNSLGSNDKDALVSADDLTPYLSAIFDAAFNRLAKEGVKGLSDASKNIFSNSSTNKAPEPYCTSMPTGPNVTTAQTEKCKRDMIYLEYGSELLDTTTTSTNPALVSTSTALSLAESALAALNDVLAPLVADVTALPSVSQSDLSLLSACEAQKTAQKAQCPTTANLFSAIISLSSDITGANSLLNTLKQRLIDMIATLNDPETTPEDVFALYTEVQQYATAINDMINKLTADKTAFASTDVTSQLNACTSTVAPAPYMCPAVPVGGGTSTSTIPTLTLTRTPARVHVGGLVKITWSTTGASSCTASGDWDGLRATSGSENVRLFSDPGSLSTYTLSCYGAGGVVSKTVNVTTTGRLRVQY